MLDFSEPIGDGNISDGGFDGGTIADGGLDASPAVCATFEPNDTTAEATFITPMDVASAICTATDVDMYTFELATGQDVSITLSFTGDTEHDLDLRLFDSAGGVIVVSSGTSNTEQINRTGAMANSLPLGTYHIEVQPITVASFVPYSLNLSLVPTPAP